MRVLAQVAFFALIGRLLDSTQAVHFLLVGNAVMIACLQAMFVVASTTWERMAGTFPLLVAAPASQLTVFLGRSVHWLASGLASATAGLFLIGPLFGLPLPWPRVLWLLPLTALVAVTTYLFGAALGALVMRAVDARNLVMNLATLTMMAISGVMVPVVFWPAWVQHIAQVLPLTHGLQAIRDLLDGAPLHTLAAPVATEAAVGAGWLLITVVFFRRLAESGRRDGSIDFAS